MPEAFDEAFNEVVDMLKESKHAIVLTGAGISAESGIPTFRGKDGLWNKYRPEELATPEAFRRNPALVWEWYAWRMNLVFSREPNYAHRAIAKLEDTGYIKHVITQNVDDLHERAGSRNVTHLHGKLKEVKCWNGCIQIALPSDLVDLSRIPEELPKCPECSGLLRPAVVWFGERLDPDVLMRSFDLAEKSDLILVVGTSAVVQPAASVPMMTKRSGGKIIEINPDETPLTPYSDISLRLSAVKAFEGIMKELELDQI
ncbi:NAD-dependent protein deacetylase, SIR2 family [Archaeoglobus sulfaticallidus PM70-1]|uniref:NAD-dependent protein deacylase n=1 Tax=Archaeoglobus sulfaticallidus PM70-1 TaxID=387631 RepID=N0BNM9_9EURY|nr:NAD-dependent protein deacetylase [Archaeoglobus sulfaticallidus]AGK61930.1 NAD-dependent protein deacetylase, SIR2 family [Archaeoglobus sulfaticallidus PM70-1]